MKRIKVVKFFNYKGLRVTIIYLLMKLDNVLYVGFCHLVKQRYIFLEQQLKKCFSIFHASFYCFVSVHINIIAPLFFFSRKISM